MKTGLNPNPTSVHCTNMSVLNELNIDIELMAEVALLKHVEGTTDDKLY